VSDVLEKEITQTVVKRQVDKLRPMMADEQPVDEPITKEFSSIEPPKEITDSFKKSIIRRSKIIIQAKRLLVLAGVLLIAAIVIYPLFKENKEAVSFSLTGGAVNDVKQGDELVQHIQKPKIYGIDESNQRYMISAEEAIQNGVKSVFLTKISGDIYLKDGGWVNILADNGEYFSSEKMMKLNGNVQIYGDNGYEMHADYAEMKMDKSEASGHDNVRLQGPLGTIDSTEFRMKNAGDFIQFSGGVHMVAYPEAFSAGE
jgi:lipopolysaccharide export system protein LptC